MEIFAFNDREMGQFAFARNAASIAQPKDRGLPGIGFHSALRIASWTHPRQYLENAMAIPLGYGYHPCAAALSA